MEACSCRRLADFAIKLTGECTPVAAFKISMGVLLVGHLPAQPVDLAISSAGGQQGPASTCSQSQKSRDHSECGRTDDDRGDTSGLVVLVRKGTREEITRAIAPRWSPLRALDDAGSARARECCAQPLVGAEVRSTARICARKATDLRSARGVPARAVPAWPGGRRSEEHSARICAKGDSPGTESARDLPGYTICSGNGWRSSSSPPAHAIG